jgi:hypothetical protein
MATSVPRRQAILLAILLVVLAATVAYQFWWAGSPRQAAAGAPGGPRGTAAAPAGTEVPDVHLEALQVERPAPVDGGRNLFRDRPEPPAPVAPVQPRPQATTPAAPTGPPPPPPITLKFIGVVQSGGRAVAVFLSDGRDILYGQEGEVVDGRYLVLKINVESVEVSYPDGTGRRVIRLTG